ncbi:MAG TPA: Ni/Fe hydrogenase subunit alpha [Verrucomicrobiota bacterium]|nr:Ni/Fe hydrogenase subunit alpha [Verrucomicrobiota bacterium]HNU49689.1 Ni/Fe hydrogenase subunit alpha [Verrucomicrobiota bacterium]
MARQIRIDPVTRIEGHAKITIHLDDAGNVVDARFHVTEFRGFERFCEQRPFSEMPGLTPRICGICPVSHLLASAKTCDALLAVDIPPAAEKLRRMMNLGQIIQSHALSFFHLSAPDFILGWDTPPEKRNVFGLVAADPNLARAGIRLRQFGQEVIERLGGRKIHPAWAVPGGVRTALDNAGRDQIKSRIPEAKATALLALATFKKLLKTHERELQVFGNFPSLFLGLVAADGTWEHYDGRLRFVDGGGNVIADQLDPNRYPHFIGEYVETHSYLKSPYYKPLGYPGGIYRVGPLARLNLAKQMGTPLADEELGLFKTLGWGAVTSSFLYHYARLIEILASVEHIEKMIDDPELQSTRLRADAGINRLEAVGVSEAPRGTLFHHYEVDENGLVRRMNLIIATGQNNLAMNRTVAQIARHFIQGPSIPEPMLNRVEAGIRAFDPCLSCSTHADGRLALVVRLLGPDGRVLDEAVR